MDNYYEILGVSEDSTQEEIKKAYRKKAVEHHPDKGGSEEVFKKIASAYDILGDENKRRDYDNRKNNPFGGSFGGFQGFNPFEEFFNNGFTNQNKNTVPDKVVEVEIGVLECFIGVSKNITYMKNYPCNTCSGSGGDRVKCGICNGQGRISVRQGTGMFIQITTHSCHGCNGKGYAISNKCFSCNGNGTLQNTENISLKIPHGVDSGQIFRVKSKGDFYNGQQGDLMLKIKIIPENNFEKSGNDLVYNLFFDYNDLMKDSVEIPHPNGTLSVNLPSEIDTSKPLRIRNKGFSLNGQGDLFIRQFVKFKKVV